MKETKRIKAIYISVLAISVIALFFSRDEFSQKFIMEIASNPLIWIIMGFFGLGLAMSLTMFFNTIKESETLEAITSQEADKILEGKMPKNSDSMIMRHLNKFHTAEIFNWTRESRSELNEYLKEVMFYWPNWLGFIGRYLPALGMLGTVLGMIEAMLDKASGGDMYAGVANAIGTTVIGLIGSIILSTLNQLIISERKMQTKSIAVLLKMKGGEKNV